MSRADGGPVIDRPTIAPVRGRWTALCPWCLWDTAGYASPTTAATLLRAHERTAEHEARTPAAGTVQP